MKKFIYGRRQGSSDEYSLLVESSAVADSGKVQSSTALAQQHDFEIRNLYRNVEIFRGKGVEGYVLFEGDCNQYRFSPQEELKLPEKTQH